MLNLEYCNIYSRKVTQGLGKLVTLIIYIDSHISFKLLYTVIQETLTVVRHSDRRGCLILNVR